MPSLTGLRFAAAAYIVLFHQWRYFLPSSEHGRYWNEFQNLGYIAVSFFFVLSGFILATVYLGNGKWRSFDRAAFLQARFGRIYPVYAFSMLLAAPFTLIKHDAHSGVYNAIKALFLTVTNFAMIQAWHPALAGNWNRPSWSVSVEAFFYLLFPVVGVWLARRQDNALKIAAGCWLVSIFSSLVCLHFVPNISANLPALELFLFNPVLRLPEFMMGLCCGVWSSKQSGPSTQRFMWVGILVCFLSIPLLVRLPGLLVANGMLSPLFGAVIVGLSTSTGVIDKLLGNKVMVRLGQASFSLYLLHFPVFFWMSFLMKRGALTDRFTGKWTATSDSPSLFALYFLLSVGVSLASFTFIETPARRAVKVWLARRAERAATVVVHTAILPDVGTQTSQIA